MLAGLITFYGYRIIHRLSSPVFVFDAAGLALFAVSGAGKALAFHAGPVAATLLGMLTGIGGGMVRDVLVREIPTVLRAELYAVAALIGAAVVIMGRMRMSRPPRQLQPAQFCALGSALWPCDAAGSFRSRAHRKKRRPKSPSLDRRDNTEGARAMSATVLICGNIFDGSSDELSGPAEILVEGNRIASIGRAVNRPPEAQAIDLSERTVTPDSLMLTST